MEDDVDIANASPNHPEYPPWKAFDKQIGEKQGWASASKHENGVHNGSTELFQGYKGEWII